MQGCGWQFSVLDRFKNVEVSEKLEPESCPLDSFWLFWGVRWCGKDVKETTTEEVKVAMDA